MIVLIVSLTTINVAAADPPEPEIDLQEEGKLCLEPEQKIALAEYIIEIEKEAGKVPELKERIEAERQVYEEALDKADQVIVAKDEEIESLKAENTVLKRQNNYLTWIEKAKWTGRGAAIGAMIVLSVVIAK